jgi:hypothetical protein
VRRGDVDHPDELRVDLDPQPGVPLAEGLGDEARPPNFPKAKGEPKRVAPSRARKETS